jgi:hypothetical protein
MATGQCKPRSNAAADALWQREVVATEKRNGAIASPMFQIGFHKWIQQQKHPSMQNSSAKPVRSVASSCASIAHYHHLHAGSAIVHSPPYIAQTSTSTSWSFLIGSQHLEL